MILILLRVSVPLFSSTPKWVQETPPALEDTTTKPNFVSSLSSNVERKIDPLTLSTNLDPKEFLTKLEQLIPERFGWKLVRSGDGWVHFEDSTLIMGYVDDLVLKISYDMSEPHLEVKSSSRIGYSDLGTNRRRVEKLRHFLMEIEKEIE